MTEEPSMGLAYLLGFTPETTPMHVDMPVTLSVWVLNLCSALGLEPARLANINKNFPVGASTDAGQETGRLHPGQTSKQANSQASSEWPELVRVDDHSWQLWWGFLWLV